MYRLMIRATFLLLKKIIVGDNVLIASKVYITDHDHGSITKEDLLIHPAQRSLVSSPVYIDDDVWRTDVA